MRSNIEDILILKLRALGGEYKNRTTVLCGCEHVTDATVFGYCLSLARVAFEA